MEGARALDEKLVGPGLLETRHADWLEARGWRITS
jgi:hypothetical protein